MFGTPSNPNSDSFHSPDDFSPCQYPAEEECLTNAAPAPVFDMNWKQVMLGDYVALPCFNSVVDRAMVIGVHGSGSIIEFVILSPDSGIPESIVLDMRRPDPQTGLFGRYGYTGVMICARRGQPAAHDFAKQVIAACEALRAVDNPRLNPFLVAQARSRLEFLKEMLIRE